MNAVAKYQNYITNHCETDTEEFKKLLASACNAVARQNKHHIATHIHLSDELAPGEFKIVDTTRNGYRKKSTGEYVPKAYLNNFGWRNTYYQCAEVYIHVGMTTQQKQYTSLQHF